MAKINERSIIDILSDAAAEARLDAEAEAEVAAGRVLPHDHVREWLKRLANGEKIPLPR